MKSFLAEIAEQILKESPDFANLVVILPNRRATVYLRKFLSERISKPVFAPSLLTIEDFIGSLQSFIVPDKLELIHLLHKSYHEVTGSFRDGKGPEPFDHFYFWGEMLLRDFDEVDKYMVNAEHLFRDLSHQKELDSTFDYLTEEQRVFLKSFWSHFEDHESINKKRFLHVWRKLSEVYLHFKNMLKSHRKAYEGMLHRSVAETLSTGSGTLYDGKIIRFVGFNALTTAEEKIIGHFVLNKKALMWWDIDQYYVNNKTQEAGKFFREYQEHPVFNGTFPQDIPANFIKKQDPLQGKIKLFGAAQPVGQAKLMSEILHRELKNINPEETLIVLPDEKLLTPVLHGISGGVEKLNVTMGFSLSNTPLFNLIETLADLQISRKPDHFNHRQVLSLLGHPYIVAADPVAANNKRKEILRHNWVHIPNSFLATEIPLHRLIFVEFENQESNVNNGLTSFVAYVKHIVSAIGTLKGISEFDKEYAFHFLKLFNRLEGIIDAEQASDKNQSEPKSDTKWFKQSIKSFLRLFRQLVRNQKIPFSGEPLKGLQVMGVLETRNLDFKNVFILSLNEGTFPGSANKGSYIPYNIRKAYKLPTGEHQDSIYAYLFYRMLQRAENIFLFYNSETDVLGQGEMSRYLQQLIYESGFPFEKKVLDNPIQPLSVNPIVIEKNKEVVADLIKLNEGNPYFKGISPSALNTYLECRLKFYFRHVARVKEPNIIEEELDARVLGNFLHDVMERFYKQINQTKENKLIELSDFQNSNEILDTLIGEVFIDAYRLDPGKKVTYEGQRLVVKEIVKRFAHRIIEMDKHYAPFVIEALEQSGITYSLSIQHPPFQAMLGGKIDRVDRKENVLRVIDYKTGKDKLNFDSIASLFTRDGIRNKAAFQTLLYALLYKRNYMANGLASSYKLIPGLINRLNLFDEEFTFGFKAGKDQITDVDALMPEFEGRLKELFNELFDPAVPFDQTGDHMNCKNCPYTQLCYR